MKNAFFYAILMAGLVLGGCNQKSAAPKEETKMSAGPQPVKIKLAELASNKDLNCNMQLEEGAIADTASYEGKVYGFCSSECKADFLKDPQAKIAKP